MRMRPLGGRRVSWGAPIEGSTDLPREQPKALPVELGNLVVDKEMIDEFGRRAGKVDDLVLEVDRPGPDGALPPPIVEATLSGPLAVAENLPGVVQSLARMIYRLFGVRDPRPVEIPWDDIIAIDVVIHAKIDRSRWPLLSLQDAVSRRIIAHLPGAFTGCDEEETIYAPALPPNRGAARRHE